MLTENRYTIADLCIGLSVVSAIFAAVGALGYDLYLASTQWMIIAIFLGIWAIYFKKR